MGKFAFRHRVTFQRLINTKDEVGEPVNDWKNVVTVWCRVEDLTGKDFVVANQVPAAQIDTVITIRWRKGIEKDMRAIVDGQVYEVKSPPLDPTGLRGDAKVMCKKVFV